MFVVLTPQLEGNNRRRRRLRCVQVAPVMRGACFIHKRTHNVVETGRENERCLKGPPYTTSGQETASVFPASKRWGTAIFKKKKLTTSMFAVSYT